MIELRTQNEIEEMRPAGRFVAEVLSELAERRCRHEPPRARRQSSRAHYEARREELLHRLPPSFGNSPFGKVICTSVNDAVLHGLPHDYALKDGDVLTLDFAVAVDGWVSDSAITVVVGTPREADLRLIDTTEVALEAAIEAARPGNKLGDISHAIGQVAKNAGYPVNVEFGGHGVGRTMHQEPSVPNRGRANRGMPLKPGLVLAIEPWFLETTDKLVQDADGWTLRSADGSRGAHSEHTVVITDGDPIILTARSSR